MFRSDAEKIAACEQIVEDMPNRPHLNLNGQCPVYYPLKDLVAVPDISRFDSSEEYYCALFHELAHSTGHESRLGRKEITQPNKYGSETYSREELTAELTAAFLCAITGIQQRIFTVGMHWFWRILRFAFVSHYTRTGLDSNGGFYDHDRSLDLAFTFYRSIEKDSYFRKRLMLSLLLVCSLLLIQIERFLHLGDIQELCQACFFPL